ncbi:MAG: tryptophan-rich sensory protein [Roseburia sp.]|nr:tryptophan-rich sensory protein [Roseburia sp.]
MKLNKRLLTICIAIPLFVGVASSLLTRGSMEFFSLVEKPPLSPPAWVFPVVWTILYTLMGISSYLILASGVEESVKEEALRAYGLQLAVNFLWPTFFFNFQWYGFSFFWLLLLWVLVIVMITRFWKINKVAAYLNVPYLIWLTFAAYLNWGIWRLNA